MAKYQSIVRANEFIDELHGRINRLDGWLGKERQKTKDLVAQLAASQAEVGRLRAALATYAVDPTSDAYYVLYCTCIPDGVDRSQIARDALTPPAAPEGDA